MKEFDSISSLVSKGFEGNHVLSSDWFQSMNNWRRAFHNLMSCQINRYVPMRKDDLGFGEITEKSDFVECNRMLLGLENVAPMPIKWEVFPFKGIENVPHGYKISEVVFNRYKAYFAWTCRVYGILRMSQLCLMLRAIMGDWFLKSNLIRKLKYYVLKVNFNADRSDDGNEKVNLNDTLAPVRVHLLLQTCFLTYSAHLKGMDHLIPLMEEVAFYIFQDPWVNTLVFKKKVTLGFQFVGCLSNKGKKVGWKIAGEEMTIPRLYDYKVINVVPSKEYQRTYNDEVYYKAFEVEYMEERAELAKLAPRYNSYLQNMLKGDPMILSKEIPYLRAMIAAAGYMRTDPELSIKEQIETPLLNEDSEIKFRDEVDPEGKYKDETLDKLIYRKSNLKEEIAKEWTVMLENAKRNNGFLREKQFTSEVLRSMTSRSAGITPEKLSTKIFGINIRVNTKMFMALIKGIGMFDILKFQDSLSQKNPGVVSYRQTPSRKTRAVFMLPLYVYVWEQWINYIMRISMTRNFPKEYCFGTASDITLSHTTGRILTDHSRGIYYSALGQMLILLMDYSAFDAHQKWWVMRKPSVDTVLKYLKDNGLDTSFFKFKHISDMIELLWGEKVRTKAYFKILSVRPGPQTIMATDMLLSGELSTILLNNVTNRSIFRLILKSKTPMYDLIKFAFLNLQGDDSASFFRIVCEYGPKVLRAFAFELARIARYGAQELNPFKTTCRRFMYEFLKVTFLYGWHVPLLHMLPFSTERSRTQIGILEFMQGYTSTMREMCNRGIDENLGTKIVAFTWLIMSHEKTRILPFGRTFVSDSERVANTVLKKGYKVEKRDAVFEGDIKVSDKKSKGAIRPRAVKHYSSTRIDTRLYYPVAILYVPQRWGGIGLLPGCGLRVSLVYAMLFMFDRTNYTLRRFVEKAITMLQLKPTNSLARDAVLNLKKEYFGPGLKFIRGTIAYDRVLKSVDSAKKLYDAYGIKLGIYELKHYADLTVERQMEKVKELSRIRWLDLSNEVQFKADSILQGRFTEFTLSTDYGWLENMVLKPGPILTKKKKFSAFTNFGKNLSEGIKTFGCGDSTAMLSISSDEAIRMLRKSKFVNNQITSEQLMTFLSKPAFFNDTKAIKWALEGMGFDSNVSEEFANTIKTNRLAWIVSTILRGFSLYDGFMNLLSLDNETVEKISGGRIGPPNRFYDVPQVISVVKCLFEGIRTGVYRVWQPVVNQDWINAMNLAFKLKVDLLPEVLTKIIP
jgi:hypothetical protein